MAGGLRKEGHGRPRRAEDTAASDSEVAHVVLLVELEAKIEKLEQDRQFLLQRNQPPMPPPQANVHHGGGQKRAHPPFRLGSVNARRGGQAIVR